MFFSLIPRARTSIFLAFIFTQAVQLCQVMFQMASVCFEALCHVVLQRAELRALGLDSSDQDGTGCFHQGSSRSRWLAYKVASLVIPRDSSLEVFEGCKEGCGCMSKITSKLSCYLMRNYHVAAVVFCFHKFRGWGPSPYHKPLPGWL